jgi:hypothetical protein
MAAGVLGSLLDAARTVPAQVGVAVVLALLVALGIKVVLQNRTRRPRRRTLRVLDLVIAPLLLVFIIILVERFRDLS